MKKIFTISILSFLLFSFNLITLSQTTDDKDYAVKKLQFWNEYKLYKSNLDNNITPIKPIDPSGLFKINDKNNFVPVEQFNSFLGKTDQKSFTVPWINPMPDAVATGYNWSQSTTTYTSISGTGTLVGSGLDDQSYGGFSIGFTFNYDGIDYTQFGLNANGFVSMGATAPTSSYNPLTSGTTNNIIACMGRDLYGIATGNGIYYQTTGSAPNRVLIVEWKNWGCYSTGLAEYNFQIQLYETTNKVVMVYGLYAASTSTTVECGIRGGVLADINSRYVTTDWSASTSGYPCTISSTVYPANGLTWTWTPVPMTYISSTVTQNTNNIYVPATNAQVICIQVVTAGSANAYNITNFSLNTNGTTNPANDITKARLWYTGLSSTFATTTQYGSTINNPSGSFSITGSRLLLGGTNYFWLAYDVPSTAPIGDSVDAECTSITVADTARTPSITAPPGKRRIDGTVLCGTYSIPGNYASIAAAIADLNSKGLSCPVVFNVAAGWRETAANLVINMTGTVTNTVTFQKSGIGANPIIDAGVGVGTYDGVIILNGVNYYTFDGIDVKDTINTSTTTQMEWGYALLRPDGTHGCQYNTIKNCNISLNKTNTATYGIYSHYINTTGTTQTITSPAGTNSNNSFLSNNISNCYNGIYLYSPSDATIPYAREDQNNTVSTTGSGRSSITNFGGSSTYCYGIYAYYQRNPTFSNTLIDSRGGTASTSYMYGIYNYAYYNNANTTITGDTITLVSAGTTSYLYGIYNYTYTGVDNVVSNNVLTGFVNPTTGSYYTYYIYNYNGSGSIAYQNSFTVTGNKIVGNSYGTATATGVAYGIYSYDYCMNFKNISNNLDSGNTVLGTTAYLGYGIYSPGTTYNATVSNNKFINNTINGTTATGTSYGIYIAGGTFTCQANNNVVANNTMASTSSAAFYCIYNASPSPATDYSYNTVSGNSSSGTGVIYSMYYSAAPGLGSTVNITNNTISNQSKTTATGTGTIYGIYQGSSPAGTLNINNNTITGFTSAAATTFYGIYQAGSPANYLNINNNKVGNFMTGGASIIYGIYTGGTTNTQSTVSLDSVYNLTSLGGTIYGMYCVNGNPANIFRNRINGISSTTSTSAVVYGMYVSGGTINNIYNNIITDLNAPASTSNPAISGIYLSGGTFDNLYYNTVFLKATSTSVTTFSTNALYASTTPNVDLRNNIFADSSTPGPTTSYSVAYRRSANSLTTYLNTSNNNCLYAGIPSASNLIFYDGTNSVQTLATYKTWMVPRDNNSFTEMPPFTSTIAPFNLRIRTDIATQLESGAQTISTPVNITTDGLEPRGIPIQAIL